jgi:hypothetical protein
MKTEKNWARLLTCVTGLVNQELLLLEGMPDGTRLRPNASSTEGIAVAGPSPTEGDQCGRQPVVPEGHFRTEAVRRTRSALSMSARCGIGTT